MDRRTSIADKQHVQFKTISPRSHNSDKHCSQKTQTCHIHRVYRAKSRLAREGSQPTKVWPPQINNWQARSLCFSLLLPASLSPARSATILNYIGAQSLRTMRRDRIELLFRSISRSLQAASLCLTLTALCSTHCVIAQKTDANAERNANAARQTVDPLVSVQCALGVPRNHYRPQILLVQGNPVTDSCSRFSIP